jgi:hypothetical protein
MNLTASVARELDHQGYAVIRGFLSNDDVSPDLLRFLEGAEKFTDGVIGDIPSVEMLKVKKKIEAFIPGVAERMGLSISKERYGYCSIRIKEARGEPVLRKPFDPHRDPKVAPGGVLNWHLDHFSYYVHVDHKNWLICYMPVMKPSKELTNLAIIPTHVVKSLDPALQRGIEGRGAMRFRCVEPDTIEWFKMRFPGQEIVVGDWFAIDDYDDSTMGWKIGIDLEKEKVVPKLETHDLLIMRADVIHRTNDAGSDRISIRCDAVPFLAPRLDTWLGLLGLTLRFLFAGEKRRYNLRNWLRKEWAKRLPWLVSAKA